MILIMRFLGCVTVVLTAPNICGCVTACKTSQDVYVGGRGTIHCSFPENVDNKQFIIYKYGLNSTNDDEEKIVNCYIFNNQQHCQVSNGFDFKCAKGPEQTVFIPNVTTRHEGMYVCQMIPGDQYCTPCVLEVKEALRLDDSQTLERNTRIHGDDSENVLQKEKVGEEVTSTAYVIGGVLSVVGLAVCFVVGVLVYELRHRNRARYRTITSWIPAVAALVAAKLAFSKWECPMLQIQLEQLPFDLPAGSKVYEISNVEPQNSLSMSDNNRPPARLSREIGYQECASEIQARKRQAEGHAQSTAEAETDPREQESDHKSDEQTKLLINTQANSTKSTIPASDVSVTE